MLRAAAAGAVLAGVLFLSACEGDTTVNVPESGSSSEGPALASGITVTGKGEVKSTPDNATVVLGIEVSASTVAEANQRGGEAAQKVIDAVKQQGVGSEDMQTVGLAINPQYEYPTGAAPRLTGYVVSNTLRVTIRDLGKVGPTIDAAAKAAGDATRVQGIQFGFNEPEPLIAEARKKAMEDAKLRAAAFADGGGVKVGDIISISEAVATSSPELRLAAADYAAATPIEPGTSATTVNVVVRYAIAR